ncbi:MAG: hypothetical protein IIB00_03810, partial [candidate division Zixibacteria bacterium]|nr:hypothetical protein [candidate division Zixibacteria bacterium]
LCKTFGLNPLLASLVMGAVTINISMMHRLIYVEMRQTEQPLYIAFFVISGASLHFDLLWSLGAVGLAYLILRVAGKWLTLVFFSARLKLSDTAKKYLGPSLITQAGVAIGLVHATSEIDRELGQTLGLIIYSTVIVYEVLGPPVIRWSLIKAGDVSEGM